MMNQSRRCDAGTVQVLYGMAGTYELAPYVGAGGGLSLFRKFCILCTSSLAML